jgi:pimeloyl-ACP methyl ester carboxylesterase
MRAGVIARATAAVVLAGTFGPTATAAEQRGTTMNAIAQQLAESHARLLAQCPAAEVPADPGALPVHITAWGDHGPIVFLVHGGVQGGIGGGPANFTGQRALAERGWRLRLIDRPGFGQSPSRGPDDMEADASLIAAHLGDGSHLVGHSFGGAEALLAAAQRPGAVRSLVLVEPALQPLLTTDPESLRDPGVLAGLQIVAGAMLSAPTPAAFATAFAQRLGTGADGGPNPSAAAIEQHPERTAALGCALLRARTAPPPEMRKAAEAVVAAGIPVLLVSGGYDPGQEATAAALARLLHGQHIVVRSPNHFIQQSNPDGFNQTVEAFMRKAEAAHRTP